MAVLQVRLQIPISNNEYVRINSDYKVPLPIQIVSFLFPSLSSQQCSPCIIPYDAIIKLEGTGEEQEFVSQSDLSKFISSDELSKWIHHTQGGPTPDHRLEFFKDVPCSLLVRLTKHFQMDLEMFQYKTNDFMNICKYY